MVSSFLVQTAIISISYFCSNFLIAYQKDDNTIADVPWSFGFLLITLFTLFKMSAFGARHLVVTILIIIWSMRIAIHLAMRNRRVGEDPRYAKLKKSWNSYIYLKSFVYVFFVQAILQYIIALPIIFVQASYTSSLSIIDTIAVCIWIIGFACETVADYQLSQFLHHHQKSGAIMTSGLWKYSRHPNYFGESLMWWAIWMFMISSEHSATTILITLLSPITITTLILFVSGIPLAEQSLKHIPAFQDYQRTTSIFIPWFPRKKTAH